MKAAKPSLLGKTVRIESDSIHMSYSKGQFFVFDPKTSRCSDLAGCRDVLVMYWEGEPTAKGCHYEFPFGGSISRWLGFSGRGTDLNVKEFAASWHEFETTLGLKDRTVIHPTQYPDVILFELPDYWIENDTKRSFLSLFIRLFAIHPGKTIDDRLKTYELAARIKPAITRFVSGYTKPTYEKLKGRNVPARFGVSGVGGWRGVCSEFADLTPDQLAGKLVKP